MRRVGYLVSVLTILLVSPGSVLAQTPQQEEVNFRSQGIIHFDTQLTTSACNIPGQSAFGGGSILWPADLDPEWIRLWTQMGAEYNIDPKLIAAVYTAEHSGTYPPTTGDGGTAAQGGWQQPPASANSSATGPFQILSTTYDGLRGREPLLPARTDRGPTDPRNDPEHASRAAAVYLQGIEAVEGLPAGSGSQPQGFLPNRAEEPYTAASVGIRYNQGPAWHDGMQVAGVNRAFEYADQVAESYLALGGRNAIAGAGGCSQLSAGDSSALGATVTRYAWDTYRGRGFYERTPDYEAAIIAAQGEGEYVGGVDGTVTQEQVPGVDCGGFVTRAMRDSGFDPNYNTNEYGGISGYGSRGGGTTIAQRNYLNLPESGWTRINVTSTADLQPGDVAINNPASHTFMWIGDAVDFETGVASSAWSRTGNGRAPMSGIENPLDARWEWYRRTR